MKSDSSLIDLSVLPCHRLTGVGQRIAERLAHLGIQSVQDLLFHLPSRYQDRSRVYPMGSISIGDHVLVEGRITSAVSSRGGRTRWLCQLEDHTGRLYLRFFYINASQVKSLQPGTRVRCFGEVRRGSYGLEMIHPEYQVDLQAIDKTDEQKLTPIYPTTEGLSQLTWRKLTSQALQFLDGRGKLQDILPSMVLQQLALPEIKEALQIIHRPPLNVSLDLLLTGKHPAQQRLIFEELLAHRLSLLRLKNMFQEQRAVPLARNPVLAEKFLQSLSFQLTKAQKTVAQQIYHDLCQPCPMLRLVQGDVGSGKTVVAALAILQAIESGHQAAVLAPSELLVEQHYQTFRRWLEPLDIKVMLLSGQMKASARRETLEAIAGGQAQVVIGTQAIFQKGVHFCGLAVIVVDEQHRFGVQQRALFRGKGTYTHGVPHQLILTATPIPRTLAMSIYADLDCSVIDELPPGRMPVLTKVISSGRRTEVLERVRALCCVGRQAYWVCTLIEESDALTCQAAEEAAIHLKEALPELSIALLHGRMKAVEKERVMRAFKDREIHLLVSTTVIEVGIDVPNASLMVIENAERLGLAQLHQLRGRVGRGTIESHCLLMYQAPLSRMAKERLQVMRDTTDGFKIARRDLELRGPGEVLGTRQTGEVSLRMADLLRDSDLFPEVQKAANILLREYPDVIVPLIKRWLGDKEQYARV